MNVAQIKEALHQVLVDYDIEAAYLYGSYARGDQTDESDIDLRFLCGSTMDFVQLLEIQERLEAVLGKRVDIATAPPGQMRRSFYDRIRADEVILYAAA